MPWLSRKVLHLLWRYIMHKIAHTADTFCYVYSVYFHRGKALAKVSD
jgi:hypothetical protein